VRLQAVDPTSLVQQSSTDGAVGSVPISRARRAAERLRRVAGER